MSKRVALVGHCGPDNSYLRIALSQAHPDCEAIFTDDEQELARVLRQGVDLVLVNRELSYGFNDLLGVDLIRRLKSTLPNLRTMLVSNYAEAQRDAVSAGALPGFGKREIGSPRVTQLLRDALEGMPEVRST